MTITTSALTMSVPAAAAAVGVDRTLVAHWARQGRVPSVKVGGRWLVDAADVAEYARQRRRRRAAGGHRGGPVRSVPADRLLRQIELAGGAAELGAIPGTPEWQAVRRAEVAGVLTEETADHLAVRLLGLTMWEVSG